MNYWDSIGRWINTVLLFIVAVLGFDTLFKMLDAQDANLIVGVTHVLAAIFLVPFRGMFGDQDYILTAAFAVLGYAILVGVALSALRTVHATRVNTRSAPQVDARAPAPAPQRPAGAGGTQRGTAQRAGRRTGTAPAGRGPQNRTATTPATATPRPDAPRNGRAAGPAGSAPRRATPTTAPSGTTAGAAGGPPTDKAAGSAPGKPATVGKASAPATANGRAKGTPAEPAATRDMAPGGRDRGDD